MTGFIYLLRERENKKQFGEAFKFAFKKVFSMLGVLTLFVIIVGGGFMLLIVPGILFLAWFLFSQYVCVYEERGGMFALNKK